MYKPMEKAYDFEAECSNSYKDIFYSNLFAAYFAHELKIYT